MSVSLRAVVLAAGKGTRMKSTRPKVLHDLCGRAMLWYVLRALRDAGVAHVVVVSNDELEPHVSAVAQQAGHASVQTARQEPQLGTGHAVRIALEALEPAEGTLLIVNGDMPLVDAALIRRMMQESRRVALSLVTVRMPLPSSFGRIVRDGNRVSRIVEERDADDGERAIDEMNAGLYAYDETKLRAAVAELRNDNAQREYYLTDTVEMLASAGETVAPVLVEDSVLVLGVNDRVELAHASARLNARICERHMRAGVTIVDPHTTYLEPELEIAADVTILPNTAIGGKSSIGQASEIGPNSRIYRTRIGRHAVVSESVVMDSEIGDYATVGPWSHVRSHSVVATGARVGNYVEIKASKLGAGVRARHLTYLGDASIGARTNVGAGTITCNFDGSKKNRTEIGEDAFIGSNSSLVAPVRVGDGALTGAGSVVIDDVPAHERVVGNPARPLRKKAPT
ncbi:MAG: bifunctional UDP-N-acetylglucosamine diphosphorylase/glucosamine-1-phosphate N-acetyltransferase GlmU [Candidatus Eremiobacteraeota bacterium]|nr:bifunctional UDP-N-acetylglucosamine diphosphorylase/glucosamine-1-phosphate N-acetyltransferase GlmU [Candidatus Eremiobacteraeota bacterium]MBV9646871.1 bifunctional UDP-N-acetylglucosamine diphosphorylase/glucosamine-1-phosphate N-acetyltransferase GlmU [Candidatus Eremiobacteraeota bacterium]